MARSFPSPHDEYLFYQTVVGAWPFGMEAPDYEGLEAFRERIGEYMLKAVREAKAWTSWSAPDEDYEWALAEFVARVLDPNQSGPFLDDLCTFVGRIAAAGAVNGLAQTVLKLTCPGVPDIYQGTEFWDFSLVDPDNRRPVDYASRRSSLHGDDDPAKLLADWKDGRIKQWVVRRILDFRQREPELFGAGNYEPVEVSGREGRSGVRLHPAVPAPSDAGRRAAAVVRDGGRSGRPPAARLGRYPARTWISGMQTFRRTSWAERRWTTASDLRISHILNDLPVALLRSL